MQERGNESSQSEDGGQPVEAQEGEEEMVTDAVEPEDKQEEEEVQADTEAGEQQEEPQVKIIVVVFSHDQ